MGSEDRIPDNCSERQEDMWSLIAPEPSIETFSSLLASNGGKEISVVKPSWDLTPGYVPIARSRSSLSSDSLQLCTEGLGCESCDCLTDSPSSESLSLEDSDDEIEDENNQYNNCEVREEKIFPPVIPPRSFPPPLPSLCASSASYMRSVKKDGRFLLQSVKIPTQNYLQSFREGGRLKMQLVTVGEDDGILPQTSSLIKPENEILSEEVDGGGGGGSDASDEVPVVEKLFSDIPEVQQSEVFVEAVSNPGDKCNGCEIQKQNGTKFKDNNKSAATKSVENHEISDLISSKTSDFNVYSGWRTELAEQNNNWQKAQALPNYPPNKFKYAEANNVNLNVNVNESCVHARVPKFRLNDVGLGRCHALKSLSVWGKSQCIATNS